MRLPELRDDAPPPRYGVEDVIVAGRRLRRRRRSAWAAGSVLAVAAAIAVPQLVSRSAVNEPVVVSTASGEIRFEATFRGYTVGRFRVRDPGTVGLGAQIADIEGCDGVCTLTVLPPGLPSPARPAGTYVWEYEHNALAWIRGDLTDAEMRLVAGAFRRSPPRPATLGFRLAHVPAEYRLTSVRSGVEFSIAGFDPLDVAVAQLAAVDRAVPEGAAGTHVEVGVTRLPVVQASATTETVCTAETAGGRQCRRWLPDGRTLIEAAGGPGVAIDELNRMVQAVTVTQNAVPANDAVPVTAQLTAK